MIFFSLMIIVIFILALIFLLGNQGQFVDISIFGISYLSGVDLWAVILVPFVVGVVLTWMFMSFLIIQHRSTVRSLKHRNRQLLTELENLRNISIDEIPDDEPLPTALPAPATDTGNHQAGS